MAQTVEMIGNKFGRITVTAFHSNHVNPSGKRERKYIGKCDCGKEIIVRGGALRSGHTTSCGCHRIERVIQANTLPSGEAGLRWIVQIYKSSARKRKFEWSITDQEARDMVKSNCWYCDRRPGLRSIKRAGTTQLEILANGIDRIDNALGYTYTNSVPCCSACNYMKHDRPLSEFLVHINRLQHLADPLPIFAGVN